MTGNLKLVKVTVSIFREWDISEPKITKMQKFYVMLGIQKKVKIVIFFHFSRQLMPENPLFGRFRVQN